MKKLLSLIAIISVVFLVGCAVVSALAGIAISIAGEFVCGELTDDPMLYELCVSATGFFFNVDAGTIEIQNENGQWITLTSQPMSFNLLDNSGTQQVMIHRDNIPPGKYNKLRIDLESIKIQTKDGTHTTIIPNKELIFDINMAVYNNQKSVVELKLDIAKSLHRTDDNKIIFAPVMDVKSRKNANVQVLNENKKLISVNGGVLLDNKKVGMDLDGKIKKNFVLERNVKLSVNNNKVIIKQPTVSENQLSKEIPKTQITVPTQPSKITGAVVATNTQYEQPTEVETPAEVPSLPEIEEEEPVVEEIPVELIEEVDKEFTVIAKKWIFSPNYITVNKGEKVRLTIIPNNIEFTFAIPNLGIEEEISDDTVIIFTANNAGELMYECSSCEDWRGMSGKITVKGDSFTEEIEEPTEEEISEMYYEPISNADFEQLKQTMKTFLVKESNIYDSSSITSFGKQAYQQAVYNKKRYISSSKVVGSKTEAHYADSEYYATQVLEAIKNKSPGKLNEYKELAIAYALVWDVGLSLSKSNQASSLPAGYYKVTPEYITEHFNLFVNWNEKEELREDLKEMSVINLIHVIDTFSIDSEGFVKVPLEDLQRTHNNLLKEKKRHSQSNFNSFLGASQKVAPLQDQSVYGKTVPFYPESIETYGGECGTTSYYTAMSGKVLGIPTVRTAQHAYFPVQHGTWSSGAPRLAQMHWVTMYKKFGYYKTSQTNANYDWYYGINALSSDPKMSSSKYPVNINFMTFFDYSKDYFQQNSIKSFEIEILDPQTTGNQLMYLGVVS